MRALVVATLLLVSGCAAHRIEFNPGASVNVWTSCTTVTLATDRAPSPSRNRVRNATVFVLISHPRGPLEGARVRVRVNGSRTFDFPKAADHSWSLSASFGVGRHDLEVEIIVDERVVYTRTLTFYVVDPVVLEEGP